MKRLSSFHIPLLAIALLTAISALAARPSRWDREAAVRKADYVFMEAVNAQLRGDDASYYHLLRHAHELNPADDETASTYALYLIHLERDDSSAVSRGLAMMKRYFDRHPSDLYSGINYALLSQGAGNADEALRVYRLLHWLNPERTGITHRYADFLAQTGRSGAIDSALAVYDTLLVAEGPSMELASAKMRVLYMRQDTAAILREARGFFNRAPMSVENNVFLADVYASFGQNDSALSYYDRACQIDPTSAPAHFYRAGFYHNTGDSAAFDREIFKVLRMDQLDVPTKLGVMRSYVAELYGDSLQTPRILDLFNALIEMHPHESELRDFYSAYLFTINRFGEAAVQQEASLDLAPDDEGGWLQLIRLHMVSQDTAKALDATARALHFFPQSEKLHMLRGSVLTETDSLEAAFSEMATALELTDPADTEMRSDLYCWMGDLMYQRDDRDSAVTLYQKSIDVNPLNSIALNNCAYYLADEGRDLDRALTYVKRAISTEDEPSSTTLDTYAWVLFRIGDYEGAREQIDKALALEPAPSDDLLEHAGDIYFHTGDKDRALEFWEQALSLAPDNKVLRKKVQTKSYLTE